MAVVNGTSGSKISITAPVTFTMFELSDIADCNALHTYLTKKGLQNLSPETEGKKTVSFNGTLAKSYGTDYINKLQMLPVDWLVLSGHHGIVYGSDYDLFGDQNTDPDFTSKCYNYNKYAGFFNNDYHHGRWNNASRSSPEVGKSDSEIYCSTTEHAPNTIAPFKQSNPYIPLNIPLLSAMNKKCKGIILAACNTLSYRAVRKKWVQHFPDAVIFGTFARIKMGLHVIKALMAAPSTTKDFWLNPQAVLNSSPDMPKIIAGEIIKIGQKTNTDIGMIYKKKVYTSSGSASNPVDVLAYDFLYS